MSGRENLPERRKTHIEFAKNHEEVMEALAALKRQLNTVEHRVGKVEKLSEDTDFVLRGPNQNNGVRGMALEHDRVLKEYPPRTNHERIDRLQASMETGFATLNTKLDSGGRMILAAIVIVGFILTLIEFGT